MDIINKMKNNTFTKIQKLGKNTTKVDNFWISLLVLLLIIGGLYMLSHPNTNLKNTTATIINAQCSAPYHEKISCNVDIKYNVNEQELTDVISVNHLVKKGDKIDIAYDPNYHNKAQEKPMNSYLIGFILLAAAALIYIYIWSQNEIIKS